MDRKDTKSKADLVEAERSTHEPDPPPPYSALVGVQSLTVNFSNWKWTKADVTDTNSDKVLYQIEFKMLKPHLRLFTAGESSPFGTATFHFHTTRIDIETRGRALEMKSKHMFSSKYSFTSPSLQGQSLQWSSKSSWKSIDYVCMDESATAMAKVTSDSCLSKNMAKVDLLEPLTANEAAKEEILVTGLALAYYVLMAQLSALT